mgnify:CR=1 FL=1
MFLFNVAIVVTVAFCIGALLLVGIDAYINSED